MWATFERVRLKQRSVHVFRIGQSECSDVIAPSHSMLVERGNNGIHAPTNPAACEEQQTHGLFIAHFNINDDLVLLEDIGRGDLCSIIYNA